MRRNFNLPEAAAGPMGRGAACFGPLRRVARVFRKALALGAVAVGLATASPALAAEDDMPLDYQVKAAFLVNFPKYVDWPAGAFADTNSPITVGIFGDDNVANEFATMIEGGRTVSGRPVVLKRIQKEEQIGTDCQILFIAASERQRVPAILDKVKNAGVLTVSENEEFLNQGGVINLVHRDRKIRLQVNLTAAAQAHLKISSRLLVVADVKKGKP
jgi:hypothetical protein